MPARNTPASYGSVSRIFHWLTALLILTTFPLGLIAENLPFASSEELALKAQYFSIHKTLGILTFFVALARILWALTQARPAPLHPERRAETFLAEWVHWSLYISLVVVPLSGWIHHAAVEGFAPILWPFGQNLPFIPKSEALSGFATACHWIFTKILLVSVALHIAGALKHVVIDRDATLARMLRGTAAPAAPKASHNALPMIAALALYILAFAGAYAVSRGALDAPQELAQSEASQTTASVPSTAAETASPESAAPLWAVKEGVLAIEVQQMGSAVGGSFANWSAEIHFDDKSKTGEVQVSIDTTSLTLGSVTAQAKEAEFFDTANHPQAIFRATIRPEDTAYFAEGTLQLRGLEKPVSLPFTLQIDGDTATMQGETRLDRRDFGMGESYKDESTVGFSVVVKVDLTATKQP